MEASARHLQQRLDTATRKGTTAETILRDITQERDSAVSQLGVAYITIEQLKVENESLSQENADLKAQFNQQLDDRKNDKPGKKVSKEESRRSKSTRQDTKATPKVDVQDAHGQDGGAFDKNQAFKSQDRNRKTTHNADANNMFDLSAKFDGAQGLYCYSEDSDSHNSERSPSKLPNRQRKGKAVAHSNNLTATQNGSTSADLTYLTFLDVSCKARLKRICTDSILQNQEIAKLRRTLEQERIERKQRQRNMNQLATSDNTAMQTNPLNVNPGAVKEGLPKKSFLKDLTSRSIKHDDTSKAPSHTEAQAEHNRRHSDTSILSTRSRRRGGNAENMTSAFIVPDITIHNPEASRQQLPELTEENHKIIHGLTEHDQNACTVCTRKLNSGKQHEHSTAAAKGQIKIAKPTPVSERKVEEDDATIRPSQKPSLALAVVLKELEDELDHLKIELARYQALYNGHDPALSKRRRKSVQQQMDVIIQAIDVKADQIYSLYDVLEGQKEDGHELSEEEVGITLQSIHMKAPELHLRGGHSNEREGPRHSVAKQPWDLDSEDDTTDELPWEGIESTVNTAKTGPARSSRG